MTTPATLKLICLAILMCFHYLGVLNPKGTPPSESERARYEKTGDSVPRFVCNWGHIFYGVSPGLKLAI